MDLERYRRIVRLEYSESTIRSKMAALRLLDDWLEGNREPTINDVEKWVEHLSQRQRDGELKISTVNRYFDSVKSYFDVVHGGSESLDHIQSALPDMNSQTPVYLTEYEFQCFRDKVESVRDQAFVEILYRYARGSQEVLLLNREDVDLVEETITFRVPKKAGSQLPSLRVGGDTYRVLETSCPLENETIDYLKRLFRYFPDSTQEIYYRGESKEVRPLFWGQKRRVTYSTMTQVIKKAADRAYIDKNVTPSMIRLSRMVHSYRSNEIAGLFAGEWLDEKYGTDFLLEISST